jgi:hypothetical protein
MGVMKGLALLQISPPRFSGFLHDWLGWQEGKLPHYTHYFSRSVVGVEPIAV